MAHLDNEAENDERIRSANEVASRCIILYAVIAAGHGESRDQLVDWLKRETLWDAVSPKEVDFLLADTPTKQQQINATWRTEALFPLVWSLGLIPIMSTPLKLCDAQQIRAILPPLLGAVGDFISNAKLRSDSEILNANEEIYQIHWTVRDAQLRNRPTPPGKLLRMPHATSESSPKPYNAGVVQERHYALNWLIGYRGQAWDKVTTDT
jgi:Domain of unknown function (DUF4272)